MLKNKNCLGQSSVHFLNGIIYKPTVLISLTSCIIIQMFPQCMLLIYTQRTCDKINNIRTFFLLISWHLPQIWHQLSIFACWVCITQLILYTRACRFCSNFLQPRRILSANLWIKGSAHLIFQKPPFEYSRIC